MSDRSEQAKAIFLEAMEKQEPDQWPAFLGQACGGDTALRAEVEKLLRARLELGSFHEVPRLAPALTVDQPVAEIPGTRIGPYKLLQEIGEGGMGTVWMAEQQEPVRRLVALKVIKAGMDSAQVIARFEAERQALALMDHPNIAKVLDAGTIGSEPQPTEPRPTGSGEANPLPIGRGSAIGAPGSGRPFFVMELVKGTPITKYCDEHRLTPRQRLELFVPVCQAIQHAHQKGIIHRDVKPSNVLVAPYDGKPVVKVIDFGVAKATGQRLTERTLFTGFGAVVGTLEYMSPEQAELNNQDIDTRSDIYSLGVLLYELLTGTTPLNRERLQNAPFTEMLRLIREEEPPRPSTRLSSSETLPAIAAARQTEPAKLTKLVRGELDWIVMKALEKERNRRFEMASAFAADVERYLKDQPVQACPASAMYRFRKLARRHKAALVTGSVIALAMLVSLAGLATSTVVIGREQQETEKALDAEIQAKGQLQKALERERDLLYLHRIALAHRIWLGNNPGRAEQLLDECPPNRRRWEWHYLKRLCHSELFTFRTEGEGKGGFEAVAFSGDGRQLAAADTETGLTVWDLQGGQEIPAWRKPIKILSSVAASADGRYLAAGNGYTSSGGELWVWDAATGKELVHLKAHTSQILNLAFSPDGKRIATASYDHTVKTWDAATGKELWALPAAGQWWYRCVAFSPDGKHLATAGPWNVLKLWDAESGQEVHTFGGHTQAVVCVAFSPDGKYLVSAGIDRTAKVWDLEQRKELVTYSGHAGEVHALAFSPDSKRVASGSHDQTVRIWDAATGQDVGLYRGHAGRVNGVAFSPDGQRLASASSGDVKVWHATRGQEAIRLPAPQIPWRVAFSPDSRRLAAALGTPDLRGELRVWEPSTGREVLLIPAHRITACDVAFSPDGRLLASAGHEQVVKLWDATTGQAIRTLRGHQAVVHGVAFSPDGRLLASRDLRQTVRVWEVGTGREVLTTAGGVESRPCSLAFSPEGSLLAFECGRGDVLLYSVVTREAVQVLRGRQSQLTRLAFSREGRLASAGVDQTVKVWDLATGQELCTLRGHTASVTDVAFSPDSRRIATASHDDTVRIWNVDSGQELLTLHGHRQAVESVAFSPNGHWLASAGRDGTVRLWDATPLEGPVEAMGDIPRNKIR
jgi:WD40 repeat protein/serine/threonine protein kinase